MTKGPIAWMARNRVAANLLMIVLLVGGAVMITQVKKEIFPEYELDYVRITVPYPGASPEEVEQGIILSIEDKVRALDGIKEVRSQALEGSGSVTCELMTSVNPNKLLQDIKNQVDQIESFPEEAERPIVGLLETRRQVISVILYGDISQYTLREFAEKTREELLQLPGVTLVELANVPDLEIAVEVSEKTLREYRLTLGEIANLVRRTSLELPGGGVRTSGGEILLRTEERRDFAKQFKDIPIVANPDGTQVTLDEMGSIYEDFEETDQEAFYRGKPAIRIDVYRIGDQNPLDISAEVIEYVKNKQAALPSSVGMATWNDRAEIFRDRINLLLKNGSMGLVLVLILLGLFLEPRLAFWVTLGIPISVIGSFLIISWFQDASINMVSLFAFIITLGIVVDDAIVVGENIYQKREAGMNLLDASIAGAKQIATPVTFAVLTNMCAFLPLFFIPGTTGKIFLQIPTIVTAVFFISLIESLFVLPAHLSIHHGEWKWLNAITRLSVAAEKKLKAFIQGPYLITLKRVLIHRYYTLLVGACILSLALTLVITDYIPFSYLPKVDSDIATAQVTMTFGVPIEMSRKIQERLVKAAEKVAKENGGEKILRGIYTQIGSPVFGGGPRTSTGSSQSGSHIIVTQASLVPTDQREITGIDFANQWREAVGEIIGAEFTTFNATIGETGGKPIDIQLNHSNPAVLEQAAKELAAELKNYKGVSDIDDGLQLGKPQINFKIKPEGRNLGVTVRDLADALRNAFYGAEALRQQRGRNEVKVLVRLPEEERAEIDTLDRLVIKTPGGGEIPLKDAATLDYGRAYSDIQRVDGRRTRSITADVDEQKANAQQITETIFDTFMPTLLKRYPGLGVTIEGQQKAFRESLDAMLIGFSLAMLGVFALLAIPFESYIQPIIIMISIPFGVIGAIIGHFLLGYEISIMSIFGIVALSGVVINDSLVLIVATNEFRQEENLGVYQSMIRACQKRFRPILLTSLTTFFGLAPMIFETSMQARFLIPMAISLGFGVLFTTFVTLLITPSLYMVIEDIKRKFDK